MAKIAEFLCFVMALVASPNYAGKRKKLHLDIPYKQYLRYTQSVPEINKSPFKMNFPKQL